MHAETRKFKDFNGNEREETFYFNLTAAECAELEMKSTGGLMKSINDIIHSNDNGKILAVFKELVLMAYGEKSDDGLYFVKSEDAKKRFASTQAYSDIFMDLATDANKAVKFFEDVLPEMSKEQKAQAEAEASKVVPAISSVTK